MGTEGRLHFPRNSKAYYSIIMHAATFSFSPFQCVVSSYSFLLALPLLLYPNTMLYRYAYMYEVRILYVYIRAVVCMCIITFEKHEEKREFFICVVVYTHVHSHTIGSVGWDGWVDGK